MTENEMLEHLRNYCAENDLILSLWNDGHGLLVSTMDQNSHVRFDWAEPEELMTEYGLYDPAGPD